MFFQSSKSHDQPQSSPIPVTESPSPETPPLTYSPSTTDCSSETRTVQMMFEDNVFPAGNLSQPWLGASDYPACQTNIILSTLSSGNCGDGIYPVADSEVGAFETHQAHGLWCEGNHCMIRDPIGAC